METFKKHELISILNDIKKEIWNTRGGLIRALTFKNKKEKATEVAHETNHWDMAINQIIELIEKHMK